MTVTFRVGFWVVAPLLQKLTLPPISLCLSLSALFELNLLLLFDPTPNSRVLQSPQKRREQLRQ